MSPPRPIPDASWQEVAEASREALTLLGYDIVSRCLPGEPGACGATFAQHACSHFAALSALADHQRTHLSEQGWEELFDEIYSTTAKQLVRDCAKHRKRAGG